ncbi:MAG: alginate lyase family protein [Bacteroides sp.]|nr:alginate lyase family protein [Bacteroides sp.]
MKIRIFSTCILFCCMTFPLTAQSIWNRSHLEEVKASVTAPAYAASYEALTQEADKLLEATPLSVMMKEKTPASGNKHDYMSQARYYWPDPSQPDGKPYVERDGVSNPELEKLDRVRLGQTADRVITLSLAWYFSGDEKYAQKATELLRVWFLNKDTRMNPNLTYAQVAPGHNNDQGRCYGVLDAYSFVEMLDAVQLLEDSKSFTTSDARQLKAWFRKLLDWMLTSEQGIEEGKQANNHSTAYDAQVIAYALYTGQKEVAARVLNEFPEKRIFTQIEPEGRQPHELRRTLAFGYSQYNLRHMIDVFEMGHKIGISIENSVSTDDRSFHKAMDFLAQYMGKEVSDWPYKQISDWEGKQQEFAQDLYRSWLFSPHRTDYFRTYRENRRINRKDRFNLLYFQPTAVDHAFAFADVQLRLAMQSTEQAKKRIHRQSPPGRATKHRKRRQPAPDRCA